MRCWGSGGAGLQPCDPIPPRVGRVPRHAVTGCCLTNCRAPAAAFDADPIAFGELALEHPHRQRVENLSLERPLERPRPIRRVEPRVDDQILGGIGQLDADLSLGQPLDQLRDLEIDDHLSCAPGRASGRR